MGEPSDVFMGRALELIRAQGLDLRSEVEMELRRLIQGGLARAGYFSQGVSHSPFERNMGFQIRQKEWDQAKFEESLGKFTFEVIQNARSRDSKIVQTEDIIFAIRLGIWPFT